VRLLCDRNALAILEFFRTPRTLLDLDREMGAAARKIALELRDADLVQPEDSHEADRIKHLFAVTFAEDPGEKALGVSPLGPPPPPHDDLAFGAGDTLVLSSSLALLQTTKHRFLVTHPFERRLELAEDAWRFACEFRQGSSVEAAGRRARISTPAALEAARFLVRRKLLWPSHDRERDQVSAWCAVPSPAPAVRIDTGCEQWEQRFRPYRLKDMGPTPRTALVASIGACQVHASTPALQYFAQQRGLALEVEAWFGMDLAALGAQAWTVILLSVSTQVVPFYEAIALADLVRARALIRSIGAHVDQTLAQIRGQTSSPILLHSIGRPGLAAQTHESPEAHATNSVFAELNLALLARVAGYDRVYLLDQDRVVAEHAPGTHWDDEYNALRHHSSMSMWGRPPRDFATARYAPPNPSNPEVPPIPEHQVDPVTPFALAHLDFIERLSVAFPVDLVVFEPNELLWPGMLENKVRAYGEKFNFYTGDHVSKYLGLNEALVALSERGVVLACASSCPVDVLRARWRLPARLPTLLQIDRVKYLEGGPGDGGLKKILDASGVSPERILLLNIPAAAVPAGFPGRVVSGVPWGLRRYLLTAPELNPVPAKPKTLQPRPAKVAAARPTSPPSVSLDLGVYRGEVVSVVAQRIRATPEAVEASVDLRALGLDSLGSLEVVSELEQRFAVEVPDEDRTSGVVFSVKALSEALLRAARLKAQGATAAVVASDPVADYDGFTSLDLPTVLLANVAHPRSAWAFKFLRSTKPGDYEYVSWPELAERAAGYLAMYRSLGLTEGDVITLLLPQGAPLVAAVVGAFFGRFLPAVSAAPNEKLSERSFAAWFGKLVAASGTRLIVCEPERETAIAGEVAPQSPSAHVVSTIPPPARLDGLDIGSPRPDAQALVQYSSGTTGVKKAVVLTHRAVLSQVAELAAALGRRADDVIVSWLPLYHDMGYVACLLFPLLASIPTVTMSPFDWLKRPEMLFEQLSQEKGTLTWLPNFAFALSVGRVEDARLTPLDLSSVRAVVNCSEPITRDVMARFADKFSPYGLRRSSLSASYAMAETTFAVTQATVGRAPRTIRAVRASLAIGSVVELAPGDHAPKDVIELVSSGRVLPRTRVEIVGDGGEAVPEGGVGEIRVASPSQMSAYFKDPEATSSAVHGEWYSTGDLGFLRDGELYVTGRKKDLIIVSGKNLYPHEVEEQIGAIAGVKPGRVVAFGIFDEHSATERAIVLAEVTLDATRLGDLESEIRNLVFAQFAVTLADVKLFTEPVLHKSTSGKLSRDRNRAFYETEIASAPALGAKLT
jgi:acyl-CoA synthetase (AMP-forming)/AMP-acid ligase II/acyl carrier protein